MAAASTSPRGAGGGRIRTAIDPVCGMTVKLGIGKPTFEHRRHDLSFLLAGLPDEIRGRSGPLPQKRSARLHRRRHRRQRWHRQACTAIRRRRRRTPGQRTQYTCPMHPADRPRRAGKLPDLRHGARADGRDGDGRAESRTRRHDAASLPSPRRSRSSFSPSTWGSTSSASTSSPSCRRRPKQYLQFALAIPAVLWCGWPFFERGCGLAPDRQSQHVHADRGRHRRRLPLQRRRGARSRASSRPRCATITGSCRSISRRRR